jgi:hypothetical protein
VQLLTDPARPHVCADVEADIRLARAETMVLFTDEALRAFIDFLNDAHIVKDGWLHRFAISDVGPAHAVLEETIIRMNEDD